MTFSLTQDFKTADELARRTREILEEVRDTGREVAITMDGKPAVVLLEASRYEWMLHVLNLSRMLHEAEESVQNGRVQPLDEFLDELTREEKTPNRNQRRRQA